MTPEKIHELNVATWLLVLVGGADLFGRKARHKGRFTIYAVSGCVRLLRCEHVAFMTIKNGKSSRRSSTGMETLEQYCSLSSEFLFGGKI
jgi:hypothetical protein